MLYAQRGEWGSTTLHGPKSPSNCCSEWVSSRHRAPRLWLYFVLITRTFSMARNGQQMRQSIRAYTHCLQSKGGFPKALLHPIVAMATLHLLHVDFTNIETTLEPNQSPRVANVLVFQDHFTMHVLAYVTPDQTVKTIVKLLYGGYISIFGALARLLSDRGTSFTSSVIEVMCKILGIKWLQTMPYHPPN